MSHPAPPEQFREVLYTISRDGKRKWVYHHHMPGRFRRYRTVVVLILMAILIALPWVEMNGKQAVLLEIGKREFTFFGTTYWATDSYIMVMVLGGLSLLLFLSTALVGRVWCGWACPQTVFLEFLFRPIERLIEGGAAERLRLDQAPWNREKLVKKGLKFSAYLIVAWLLATTFLAYFLGAGPMSAMVTGSPLLHPGYFLLTLVMMGVILFEFGWFREQFCTIVCPYARFQSVLLDAQSLIIGYDRRRGEPRQKGKREANDNKADCVDCGMCIRVCPTGIDIRNGLQLECIQCAQCLDACDDVMDRVGRPRGLIRYGTEESFAGKPLRLLRPRVVLYSILFVGYITALAVTLSMRATSEMQLIRAVGAPPYTVVEPGRITNLLQLHLSNKGDEVRRYTVVVDDGLITVTSPLPEIVVGAGSMSTVPLFFSIGEGELVRGRRSVLVEVRDDAGWSRRQEITIVGPG